MTVREQGNLLPCPFCGSSNIGFDWVETYSTDSSYGVFGCRACDVRFETDGKQAYESDVAKWNTRATAKTHLLDRSVDHRKGVTDLEKETILTLVRVFDASLRTNNEPEIVEAFMQAAELIDRLKARGLIRRSPITQAEELKAAMKRLYGSDSPD